MRRSKNTKKYRKGPNLGNMSQRTGTNANSNIGAAQPTQLSEIIAMTNPSKPFSMREEARNTTHNAKLWNTELRSRPVVFVSAGPSKPVDIVQNKDGKVRGDSDERKGEDNSNEKDKDKSGPPKPRVEQQEERILITTLDQDEESEQEQHKSDPMDIGTKVDLAPNEAHAGPGVSWEDSLVRGLDVLYSKEPPQTEEGSTGASLWPMDIDAETPDIKRDAAKTPPAVPEALRQSLDDSTAPESSENPAALSDHSNSSAEVILFRGRNRGRGGRSRGNRGHGQDQSLCGSKTQKYSFGAQQRREKEEEEEAAIMADYIANMAQDSSDHDASEADGSLAPTMSWKLAPTFTKRDIGEDIPAETELQASCPESTDEADEYDRGEDDNDDKAAEMDDETLARLLSKQEELGMGMDDLMIYDSNGYFGSDTPPPRGRTKRRSGPKKFSTKGGQYPSASKLADALEECALDSDLSLSLAQRKCRKGQPPPFRVDDSEIEAALSMAWEKDRLAKKEKKQRREELRSQGILANRMSLDDMRVKYPIGIRIDEVKEELRAFLMGSDESLAFCPLDHHGRRVVHLFASKLKLKSKSVGGKGVNRHTVVFRTKSTPSYNLMQFEANVVTRGRQFFPRPDVKGVSRARSQTTDRKTIHLRGGDVVSRGVPEIGSSNKGREMLEKMGWSKGTALGSENNKGILEPVTQVVKTDKRGLGAVAYD